jgi:hypothetical protein
MDAEYEEKIAQMEKRLDEKLCLFERVQIEAARNNAEKVILKNNSVILSDLK